MAFAQPVLNLLKKKDAFDGAAVEAPLAHDTEKKRWRARQGGAAQAWQGDKKKGPRHRWPRDLLRRTRVFKTALVDRLDSLYDGIPTVFAA